MTNDTEAIRQSNADSSSLLVNLPAELRVRIYEYVFLDEYVKLEVKEIHAKTALLRSCHLIRKEAEPIFYAQSWFVITDAAHQELDVKIFLDTIGKDNA